MCAINVRQKCLSKQRKLFSDKKDILERTVKRKEYTNSHADKLTSRFTHSQNLSASCIQLKLLKLENGMILTSEQYTKQNRVFLKF